MFDKQVMPMDAAEAEINGLLDQKKVFPKQRERLQPAIEAVSEAMSYGYVSINDDGSITQKLVTPIGDLEELVYAARVEPMTINKAIQALKVDNQANRNLVYISSYTGKLQARINQLEPTDRNIAESISFFFQ